MIIGVGYKSRSGKDTLAGFIREEFERQYNRKFYEAAFAFELKNMCKFQFGLSDDQLWGDKKEIEDKRFPKRPDINWDGASFKCGTIMEPICCWTPREIMQELGEFYRRIDYDFWVKGVKKFLDHEVLKGHGDFIITDVRHTNEAVFIKSEKGFLINVGRDLDNRSANQTLHGTSHVSEISLDSYEGFDMFVDNNGDLADLKVASYNIVKAIIRIEHLMNNGGLYNGNKETKGHND